MENNWKKEFDNEVINPMIFTALTVVIATIAFDYAFQIVQLLEIL